MRQKFARITASRAVLIGAATVAAVAVIGTTVGYASMGKSVTLNIDGHVEHVTATGDTVGQVLSSQGISLARFDGKKRVRFRIGSFPYTAGKYWVTVGLSSRVTGRPSSRPG